MAFEEGSFRALGPTVAAFDTHGTDFQFGVDVWGKQTGVVGKAQPDSNSGGIGVQGTTTNNRGWGVQGIVGTLDTKPGVGPTPAPSTLEAAAVAGFGHLAPGVYGRGEGSPGGQFAAQRARPASGPAPQINLVPQDLSKTGEPMKVAEVSEWQDFTGLPREANVGDLLLTIGAAGTFLWLCVSSSNRANKDTAQWRQVLLSSSVGPGTD